MEERILALRKMAKTQQSYNTSDIVKIILGSIIPLAVIGVIVVGYGYSQSFGYSLLDDKDSKPNQSDGNDIELKG